MLLTVNHSRQLDLRSAHLNQQGTGIILSKFFFATSKLNDRDHLLFRKIILTETCRVMRKQIAMSVFVRVRNVSIGAIVSG